MNHNFLSCLIPVGLIALGFGLYTYERLKLIRYAADQIMTQLNELDPIARVQVVAYLADQEIEKITR